MGRSAKAAVVYGYDLGGADDGWTFVTYNEETYAYNWPEWMELDDGESPDDPATQMEDRVFRLLSPFEVIEDYSRRPEDYNAQCYAARQELGISTRGYGGEGWGGYVLGFELASGYGCASLATDEFDVDFTAMARKLTAAKEVLGVEFEGQPAPQLMLLSSYF